MRIDDVTSIIERFADAGFTVPEIIALLVSHTIAAAVRIFRAFIILILKTIIGRCRPGRYKFYSTY